MKLSPARTPLALSQHRRMRTGLAVVVLASALLTAAPLAGAADQSVQSTQQVLRERGFFFGEISGTLDEPTRGALRRFQIREGLAVTGEIDAATAAALQVPSPATAPATPAAGGANPGDRSAEIPMRERTRTLQQSDQEFLREVEAQDDPPVRRPRAAAPPPPPRAEAERPPSRELVEDFPPAEVSEVEVQRFVERFIRASEGRTPDAEVALYADRVDYFGTPRTTRDSIARDQASYYRRWPSREFTLVNEPQIVRRGEDTATVRYRLRYQLRSGEEATRGDTEHIVRLRRDDEGRLKIAAIRERKLGE